MRVRFAPSPTGPFHLGAARTALFNWLLAKKNKGDFLVRFEDTDRKRSQKKYEKDIIKGLKWLGLVWDEKLYFQSQRGTIYEKYIKKLLKEDKAYYCFCAKEEIALERQAMLSQGLAPKYSGRCRDRKKPKFSKSSIIRFKAPEIELDFIDLIRGKIKFNASSFGDIVIAKDLKTPLYNLAVVIDDFEMKITHIIRGEDHISNTPKQILLQQALNFPQPIYAHLPLILSPERKKLSKRYSEVSLNNYKEEGYLAEAMINFLAFLGWHPKEEKYILSREELIQKFNLKDIQKGGAALSLEKLDWFNKQYINKLPPEELKNKLKDFIPEKWFKDENFLLKIIETEKTRIKKLSEFEKISKFFFTLPHYPKELLLLNSGNLLATRTLFEKTLRIASYNNLQAVFDLIEKIKETDFQKQELENKIMPLSEKMGRGEILWPLRAALSGQEASPPPFEIMEILGKKKSLSRIKIALKKLHNVVLSVLAFFFLSLVSETSLQPELLFSAQTPNKVRAANNEFSAQDLKEEIEMKSKELREIQEQRNKTLSILKDLGQEKSSLEREIRRGDYQVNQLKLEIKAGQITLSKLSLEINSLNYQIDEIKKETDSKQEAVKKLLQALQESAQESPLIIFLRNTTISQNISEIQKIIDFQNEMSSQLVHLRKFRQEKLDKIKEISNKQQEQKWENLNLENRKIIIEDKKKERQIFLRRTKNQEIIYQRQLQEQEELHKEIHAEIEKIEQELREKIDPGLLPAKRAGVLLRPVKGGVLSQGYGYTKASKWLYASRRHNGIDIAVPMGTPVMAAEHGKVIAVLDQDRYCWRGAYGKSIVIEHDNNLNTLYAHLSRKIVKKGDLVQRGQIIGYSGNTGYSVGGHGGFHLHFTVYSRPTFYIGPSRKCGPMPFGGDLNPLDYISL